MMLQARQARIKAEHDVKLLMNRLHHLKVCGRRGGAMIMISALCS
jgi:hypothetical protein